MTALFRDLSWLVDLTDPDTHEFNRCPYRVNIDGASWVVASCGAALVGVRGKTNFLDAPERAAAMFRAQLDFQPGPHVVDLQAFKAWLGPPEIDGIRRWTPRDMGIIVRCCIGDSRQFNSYLLALVLEHFDDVYVRVTIPAPDDDAPILFWAPSWQAVVKGLRVGPGLAAPRIWPLRAARRVVIC